MKKYGIKISNLIFYYETIEEVLSLISKVIDCDVVEVNYSDAEKPIHLSFKIILKSVDDNVKTTSDAEEF